MAKQSTQPQAQETAIPPSDRAGSLIARMAGKYQIDADKLKKTLKDTVFRGQKKAGSDVVREATDEELMTLLIVAEQYNLNPFTKEIYAFPDDKRGGIIPVVSVDGWIRIINEKPTLSAIEFEYHDFEPGWRETDSTLDPYILCRITRSDRTAPLEAREYLAECYRDTGPWQSHPRRMLRHKAMIQAARIAFGFAGIFDQDEAERIRDANAIEGTATEVVRGKPRARAPRQLEQLAPGPNFSQAPSVMAEKVAEGAALVEARRELDRQTGEVSHEESLRLDAELAAREAGRA